MFYRKIIERPSVALQFQGSPSTCWFASLFMLFNWKRGTPTAYGDVFAQAHLPRGIYGLYVLQELAREGTSISNSGGNIRRREFNLALNDIESSNLQVGAIYSEDSISFQQQRLSNGPDYDYLSDFQNRKFKTEFVNRITRFTGSGLPPLEKTRLLTFTTNNFKPIPENRIFTPKEWFAMINHFGPLMVSVVRNNPETNTLFGHIIIVDGFYGSSTFGENDLCQIYYQDPLLGTKRGQLFPHFQEECRQAINSMGSINTNYVWHANKAEIRDLSIRQCVEELDAALPSLRV